MMSPLLLLLFNRPDLTEKLVSILRSIQPDKIYIAVDGPRPNKSGDAEKVRQVLEIARSIDWASNIRFLIRDQNLGCGKAVSSAIDWFFDQEERGIILEDDCHPAPDFFPFCDEMLARYAEDPRVATVGGHSFISSSLRHPAGYFFSKYTQIWGWATWRRFWKTYDFRLNSLSPEEWGKVVCNHTHEGLERTYWLHIMELMLNRQLDTWDFQVQLCVWRNDQLNVGPGNNLVANVGFREDATHTVKPSRLASRKALSLSGPFPDQAVKPDPEIDEEILLGLLFASELFLAFLFRKQDDAYAKLVALNQELTRAAEHHDAQLKEFVDNLNASAEAYQAKIAALEKQIAYHASRTGWLYKVRSLFGS